MTKVQPTPWFTKFLSFFFVWATLVTAAGQHSYDIIPKPVTLQPKDGHFTIDSKTTIVLPPNNFELAEVAEVLQLQLLTVTGNKPEVVSSGTENVISFVMVPKIPMEGYRMSVDENRITIVASTPTGIFYGIQTLFQLMPPEIYSSSRQPADIAWEVPACDIIDQPRFDYRGAMLDVGRHYMPVGFIKKFLDLMAMHKMNEFHWHLTEDQGWRIEIKKYPKLTEVGSQRKETMKGHYTDNAYDGTPYGGYYTQDEVRDIVAYAARKKIEVVPEIEMPGHALAAIAAYPELGCGGKKYEVGTRWGVYDDIYCPTETTFKFLEDVLTEVIDLFPGKYVHIGGDEAPKAVWEKSAFVQKLMKEKGLKNEHEVQSYFIKRIDTFLTAKGKKMIGWDEILEGGISPNAIIMSWRGVEGGIAAVKAKHQAIMTPTGYVYFDYYQGEPAVEPLAIGGYLPIERVYSFNPVPADFTDEEAKYILGTQCNLWTEYIPTPEQAEYMLFPRLTALAEVAWTPNEEKNYDDFTERLLTEFKRLTYKGVNFARSFYNVNFSTGLNALNQPVILLSSADNSALIRYTIDGTQPNANSLLYPETGIPLTADATVTATAFDKDGEMLGNAISRYYAVSKITAQPYVLKSEPQGYTGGEKYGLTNGIRGTATNTAAWVGFNGQDLNATFNFGNELALNAVTIGFLNNPKQWIAAPKSVEVWVSDDGENFRSVKKMTVSPTLKPDRETIQMKIPLDSGTAGRYLKITAENYGDLPKDNPGHGHRAWLFVDEIGVE